MATSDSAHSHEGKTVPGPGAKEDGGSAKDEYEYGVKLVPDGTFTLLQGLRAAEYVHSWEWT